MFLLSGNTPYMTKTVIQHLQQPTNNSCMSTILAMMIGEPVHSIIDKYHEAFTARDIWYDDVLKDYRVPYIRGQLDRTDLMSGFAHFLTVPSLNMPGNFHGILVVWAEGSDEIIVLDPNYLKEGKRYYLYNAPDDEPMAQTLINWRVDIYIPLADQGRNLEITRAF